MIKYFVTVGTSGEVVSVHSDENPDLPVPAEAKQITGDDFAALIAHKGGDLNGVSLGVSGLVFGDSQRDLKMIGVEFEGVMCSATAEDMFGLSAVTPYIKAGMDLPPFRFDNGSTLKLTQANIAAFEAVWIPFRASFFE